MIQIENELFNFAEETSFEIAGDINSDENILWSPENYLEQLYSVEHPVTSFFENVLVMDDDSLKCGNRLWLCNILADWSARHLDLKSIVFS